MLVLPGHGSQARTAIYAKSADLEACAIEADGSAGSLQSTIPSHGALFNLLWPAFSLPSSSPSCFATNPRPRLLLFYAASDSISVISFDALLCSAPEGCVCRLAPPALAFPWTHKEGPSLPSFFSCLGPTRRDRTAYKCDLGFKARLNSLNIHLLYIQ